MRRTSCKLGNDCLDDAFIFFGQNRFAHDLGGRPSPVRLQLRGCQRRGRAGTSKSQQRYVALQQIRRSIFYSLFISGAKKLDATSTRTSPTDRGPERFPPSIPKFGSSQGGGVRFVDPDIASAYEAGGSVSDTIFLKTTPRKVDTRVTRLCRNLK